MLLVYVAAPFEDGAFVREAIHGRLRKDGITPTSRWCDESNGSKEDFARYAPAQLRQFAAMNDADLRGSDVCLVLARAGVGGEMFAESRVALEWGKPLVWVGRRTLSAWRAGVVVVDDFDAAFAVLVKMRDAHADGYRGHLLAHLASAA